MSCKSGWFKPRREGRVIPVGEIPIPSRRSFYKMDRLHADVWEVFSSAKGEKLEALLNRRPQ